MLTPKTMLADETVLTDDMMLTAEPLKVLLIEDDEDDFLLTRELLSEVGGRKVDLRWEATYQDALRAIERGGYDVCLVDYGLGERTGLDLLREAGSAQCSPPMIMLTSHNNYDLDAAAMRAGAADYLVKGLVNTSIIERSIRYALQRSNQFERLRGLANRDELTGLYNRRALDGLLQDEASRHERYGRPFSLVMLDVDYFKAVNDSYGHPVGDEVLRWLARLVRDCVRAIDMPARYGGEELAVVLPEMDSGLALKVAERLRLRVAARPFSFGSARRKTQLPVTVSLGVAALPDDAVTAATLVAAADRALYAAKRGGRNRSIRFRDLPLRAGQTPEVS
ncbi:MAG TPA: diguanylate cyclase [Pyrinomonadaceae bacterium]|nr:diguanylate cyclase [Pyrinomonadaceae bacterium]